MKSDETPPTEDLHLTAMRWVPILKKPVFGFRMTES